MFTSLTNTLPTALPAEAFEKFKKTLPPEMRKQVEKRHLELQHEEQKRDAEKEIKLSKILDRETLFRFAYVPFVIAKLAWDYADTITTMAAFYKLSEDKRLCREVKRLKCEYDRERSPYIDMAHQQSEEDNMYVFEDGVNDLFKLYFLNIDTDIKAAHPELDDEQVTYLKAIYQCHIVLKAIYEYVKMQTIKIEKIVGHTIGDILPKQLRQLDKYVLEFAKGRTISPKFECQQEIYIKSLANRMALIELNDVLE